MAYATQLPFAGFLLLTRLPSVPLQRGVVASLGMFRSSPSDNCVRRFVTRLVRESRTVVSHDGSWPSSCVKVRVSEDSLVLSVGEVALRLPRPSLLTEAVVFAALT